VIFSRQSILPAAGFLPAHSLPLCFAASLHPCQLSPRWSPVVFPWETPSISFPFMPLHNLSRHNEGGTPTPINLSPSFNGRQCHFSLTPVLATHPKNAPVTPFLATLPKTQVFKVLCLPHIQKMAGVGVLLLTRNPIKDFGPERKTTGLKTGHYNAPSRVPATVRGRSTEKETMKKEGTMYRAPTGEGLRRLFMLHLSRSGENCYRD